MEYLYRTKNVTVIIEEKDGQVSIRPYLVAKRDSNGQGSDQDPGIYVHAEVHFHQDKGRKISNIQANDLLFIHEDKYCYRHPDTNEYQPVTIFFPFKEESRPSDNVSKETFPFDRFFDFANGKGELKIIIRAEIIRCICEAWLLYKAGNMEKHPLCK